MEKETKNEGILHITSKWVHQYDHNGNKTTVLCYGEQGEGMTVNCINSIDGHADLDMLNGE